MRTAGRLRPEEAVRASGGGGATVDAQSAPARQTDAESSHQGEGTRVR